MQPIKNDILTELKQLSPLLANMERVNVFTIPVEYFDKLSDKVHLKIKTKKITQTIPEKYFESLADNILHQIKTTEIATVDNDEEYLSTLPNKNVFNAPEGYFETLAADILTKAKQEETKVIPIKRNLFKYAAAAVTIGIIVLASIIQFNANTKHIAVQPTHPILIAQLDVSVEKGIKMSDKQFDEALNNLSVDDIANYLENHTNEIDITTLTSNIDEDILPTEDDYFLDEKALDNYLQTIDTNYLTN